MRGEPGVTTLHIMKITGEVFPPTLTLYLTLGGMSTTSCPPTHQSLTEAPHLAAAKRGLLSRTLR